MSGREAARAETPEWSPALVVRAIRESLGLVALSYAPYFPAIFDRDLVARVRPPSGLARGPLGVADPWPIEAAGKRYYVPGSLDDLLCYTSCVVAFGPAILRAWDDAGAANDCGPPTRDELLAGSVGERPWKSYWNDFHRRSFALSEAAGRWVLDADVERCAERVDPAVLARLLAERGAHPDAVAVFSSIHEAWTERGFPGLPVIGTFGLLTRMYLLAVDETLRREGLVFLRTLDDVRIFCRSSEAAVDAAEKLREALSARGLRLNEAKTTIELFGTPRSLRRRWRRIARGKLRYGLARPFLARLARWPLTRPPALAALRFAA